MTPVCLAVLEGHKDVITLLVDDLGQEMPSKDEVEFAKECAMVSLFISID